MAKENKKGFSKPIRNRGEDIGVPLKDGGRPYDYAPENEDKYSSQERAVNRKEIRTRYDEMYRLEQERDQRAFERVQQMKNEFFAGVDPRRRQEVADAGMIREDHAQMANLSRRPIHREFPQAGYYASGYLDDTVRGSDMGLDDDGTGV